jgi:phosphopantothenoylcysteine synthetase/decarboxylase
MTPEHDFLDNLANHQHQKMLREIANDDITPKKRDTIVQNDIYERQNDEFEDDGLDYDTDAIPLAEF